MAIGPRRSSRSEGPVTGKRRVKWVTKGFDQGQVDIRVLHRTDAPQIRAAAKRMRNWAIVTGGAAARRPGSSAIQSTMSVARDVRLEHVVFPGDKERLLIFPPEVAGSITLAGAGEASASSQPWETSMHTMQMTRLGYVGDLTSGALVFDEAFAICSQEFFPRILAHSTADGLTGLDFPFEEGPDGETLQPYFRYAPRGVTLTPSGLSGSITLELGPGSPSHWTADHVGAIVRYHGKEIEVTAVTDGDTATGTVLASKGLFPTHALTVGSTAAFAPGDPIQGDETGVQATVAAITDATHMDVIYEGYSTFDVSTPERIVGPNGYTTASASTNTTPAASVQWDEAMISDFAGYPGGCLMHKGRLFLFDFPKAQSWVAASVVDNPFSFEEGAAELDDAIIDGIGGSQTRIRHAVSAEQLLLFTTRGPYYVGESAEVPIAPTTWNVNRIAGAPIGDCAPVFVDEAVVFASGSRMHALTPTGNNRRPWEISDLDTLAGGPNENDEEPIIRNPKRLAFTAGLGREKTRYLYVLNEDGTLAVFRHELGADVGGWTPWTFDGLEDVLSIVAADDRRLFAFVHVPLTAGGEGEAIVELSFDSLLDVEKSYSAAVTGLAGASGLALTQNGVKLYDGSINGSGQFVRDDTAEVVSPAAGLAVGWDFTSELVPVPPTDVEMGAAVVEIQGVLPRLVDTQAVTIGDEPITSLDGLAETADPDDVLPRRSWTPDAIHVGDSGEDDMREPELVIAQTSAARCTVAAISWRVAYGED